MSFAVGNEDPQQMSREDVIAEIAEMDSELRRTKLRIGQAKRRFASTGGRKQTMGFHADEALEVSIINRMMDLRAELSAIKVERSQEDSVDNKDRRDRNLYYHRLLSTAAVLLAREGANVEDSVNLANELLERVEEDVEKHES